MDSHKARGVQFVADRILNPPAERRARRRSRRPGADARAAEPSCDRGSAIYTELCFACHGDDGRGTPLPGASAGTPDGAVAGRLAPRQRPPRLRDQGACCTASSGPIGRQDLSAGDGRRWGRTSDQWLADIATYIRNGFGNSGVVGDAGRRRPGSRRHRRPEARRGPSPSSRRRCRARSIPDATWKATRQPQPRAGRGRAALELPALDERRAAAGRHVVPGRAARPVMLTEIQFDSPAIGGGRAGPPPAATYPRGYQVEVSADGATWSAPVAEGRGNRPNDLDCVRARPRQIRPHHQTAPVGQRRRLGSIERLRLYQAPPPSEESCDERPTPLRRPGYVIVILALSFLWRCRGSRRADPLWQRRRQRQGRAGRDPSRRQRDAHQHRHESEAGDRDRRAGRVQLHQRAGRSLRRQDRAPGVSRGGADRRARHRRADQPRGHDAGDRRHERDRHRQVRSRAPADGQVGRQDGAEDRRDRQPAAQSVPELSGAGRARARLAAADAPERRDRHAAALARDDRQRAERQRQHDDDRRDAKRERGDAAP